VIDDVLLMARSAETNPPKLIQFDPWGNRIDKVIVDSGWTDLHKVSAKEKIVKIGYERKIADIVSAVAWLRSSKDGNNTFLNIFMEKHF
jgi:hypothetical protein